MKKTTKRILAIMLLVVMFGTTLSNLPSIKNISAAESAETTYTINVFIMDEENSYILNSSTTNTGYVGSQVSVGTASLEGFVVNEELSVLSSYVKANGETILEVYYDRVNTEKTVKLIPADGSTTIIDRRGEGTASYGDSSEWYVYGLDELLSVDNLEKYLKVQGEGTIQITCSSEEYVGTGTVISVFDSDTSQLVEKFTVIIFGDINGDSYINAMDCDCVEKELNGETSWNVKESSYFDQVKVFAADVDRDGEITYSDYEIIQNAALGYTYIEQTDFLSYYDTYAVKYIYTGTVPANAPALPTESRVEEGTVVKVADVPLIEGYAFSGWIYDGQLTESFVMPANNIVITGEWVKISPDSYIINCEYIGRTPANTPAIPPLIAKEGDVITVPSTPMLDGYTFVGWYYSGEIVTSFIMPDRDVTLTGYFIGENDTIDIVGGTLTAWDGLGYAPKAYIDGVGYYVENKYAVYDALYANLFSKIVCQVINGVIISCKPDFTESYFGTFDSYVRCTPLEGEPFISEITVGGVSYTINDERLRLDYTFSENMGKNVVFTTECGKVVWISLVSDLESNTAAYYSPISTGTKYVTNADGGWVKNRGYFNIYNSFSGMLYNNDELIGLLSKFISFDASVSNVKLISTNENVLTFNGNKEINIPINKVFGVGENRSYYVDIELNSSAKNPAQVKCILSGTKNGEYFEKETISNFIYVKNTVSTVKPGNKPIINNSTIEHENDKIKIAAEALKDIKGAASITHTTLAELFTNEQLDEISNMLLCQVAMATAPKDKFSDTLSDKILDKVFKCKTKMFGIYEDEVGVTVAVNTKYGEIEVKFICSFAKQITAGEEYAFTGTISFEIVGGKRKLPNNLVTNSDKAGYLAGVDMKAFCDAAWDVAADELKKNYKEVWGEKVNNAVDIIFGESVNKILKYTESITGVGSVSDIVWKLIITPAKKIKIDCPVDIYIYNSKDILVASVENNEITKTNENVEISVAGDSKTVILYDDSYKIVYRATADGFMNVHIDELAMHNDTLRQTSINNIPLTLGEIFFQSIDDAILEGSDYKISSYKGIDYKPDKDITFLHKHKTSGDWYIGEKSTCLNSGWDYALCDVCEEWFSCNVAAMGHQDINEDDICDECYVSLTTTDPITPPVTELKATVCIPAPSTTTINYGDSIWLHAELSGELPADAKIIWTPSNNNFEITEVSADGLSCKITPKSSGTTTFTVSVVDANENVLSTDTQDMNAKAGLWQKIVAFFKKLFGATKTYPDFTEAYFKI